MGQETMAGKVLPLTCARGLYWVQDTGFRVTVAEWNKQEGLQGRETP